MKHWLTVLGLTLSGAALAAGPSEVRKQIEASMLLTGTVVVAPDGNVRDYFIDNSDKVPAAVLDIVRKTTAHWLFAPVMVGNSAVAAKAKMSLRVVATPAGGENYSLAVSGANFGDAASGDGYQKLPEGSKRQTPAYPRDALEAHVSGTAYLLLRLDGKGHVEDAAAEQVNLDVVGSDQEMQHWRGVLARASLVAARRWILPPPPDSPLVEGHWLARVPVVYTLRGWGVPPPRSYGEWQAYVPGPRQLPAWALADDMLSASADAIPDEGVFDASGKFRLITPPDRG